MLSKIAPLICLFVDWLIDYCDRNSRWKVVQSENIFSLFLVESGTYFTFRTTGGSNELSVFQICLKSTKKTVSLVAMAETEQQSGKAQLKASAQR